MNKFKVKRNTVICAHCRHVHLSRQVVSSKVIRDDIQSIGFECSACHKWTRLYFETPLITETRNQLAAQALNASHARLQGLRRQFTSVFVTEQNRVKKLLSQQTAPESPALVLEGVKA